MNKSAILTVLIIIPSVFFSLLTAAEEVQYYYQTEKYPQGNSSITVLTPAPVSAGSGLSMQEFAKSVFGLMKTSRPSEYGNTDLAFEGDVNVTKGSRFILIRRTRMSGKTLSASSSTLSGLLDSQR
jgi:hypothetical protein